MVRGLHAAAQLMQAELVHGRIKDLRALLDGAEPRMRHPVIGQPQREGENAARHLAKELGGRGEEDLQPLCVERLLAQMLAETPQCKHAGVALYPAGKRLGFALEILDGCICLE